MDLKSGIHLITLSETCMAHEDIMDTELDISGYQYISKESWDIVVYARKDMSVFRRTNLEDDSIEGL